MPIWKAIKIALPMGIIVGLGVMLFLAKRDAETWRMNWHNAIVAGEQARAEQLMANARQEARWRAQSEKADADYQTALEHADGRSRAFIAANPVSRVCAQGNRPAGGADPVPETESPQRADSSGGQAELVAVTPEDVNICSDNTARLEAARDWALGLGD